MIAIGTLFVLFFGMVLAANVFAAEPTKPQPKAGERLITIHDSGKDRGILTKAKTLREAFDRAHIPIDQNDLVEPDIDEPLVASNYEVNIYRARPVTIVDGSVRVKVMSAYQTPSQIAKQAGVELHDEDLTDISATDDIVSEGAGVKLAIDRATPFTFVIYGKTTQAYTQEATVGDMLKKKKVTLGQNDILSVDASSAVTPGMTVELWRNGVQTVSEEQDVAYETEKIQDADREVGFREVKTPGEKGKRTVTFEVEMKNGQEISRKEIQSVTTQEPKKQVEIVGTKKVKLPYTGGGSRTEWMTAAGIAESDFGYVDYIIGRESGWNPNAENTSSGACGLAQAHSCSKVPGNPFNPVDSLRWANGYAQTCVSYRMYCGWEGAYNYWRANGHW